MEIEGNIGKHYNEFKDFKNKVNSFMAANGNE